MIFQPAVIALQLSTVLLSVMVVYAASFGVQILRDWNIKSGSDLQLIRERKTYLISTILSYLFVFQLLSLFLFVFTADHLHTLLVGAMCASGSLYANSYGYPALIFKMINFLLAGLWLIINYTDNKADDYPLIKIKYGFLIALAPLFLAESGLQTAYFLRLKPNIITSCCGSLFSIDAPGLTAGMASLPLVPTMAALISLLALVLACGVFFLVKRKGIILFAILSGLIFPTALAGIITFLSVYIYELPTHHCPFCLLQREYGYIGYALYLSLFGAVILGLGGGIITPFHRIASLSRTIPRIERTLVAYATILFALFLAIVLYKVAVSNYILDSF